MYIEPVLAGILITIFVELMMFTGYTLYCLYSGGGDDHDDR